MTAWAIVTGYVAVGLAMAVYVTECVNEKDARIFGGHGLSPDLKAMNALGGLLPGAVWPVTLLVLFIMGVADE